MTELEKQHFVQSVQSSSNKMTESERENIIYFIRHRNPCYLNINEIKNGASLFLSNILDSLTFVQLIVFLEKEFKVKLVPVMKDFDTLDLIVGQVEKAKDKY